MYVLMSRKTAKDYDRVFKCIFRFLRKVRLVEVVRDFERAVWKAFRDNVPNIVIIGCAFHWTQALFRNLKKCGLGPDYLVNEDLRFLLRKVMSLYLLPYQKIKKNFYLLKEESEQRKYSKFSAKLADFFSYMESTWIETTLWSPKTWSVFMQHTRTNNGMEGCYNRLKRRAGKRKMNFYELVSGLHKETRMLSLQMNLLSRNKLTQCIRKTQTGTQHALFTLWDKYNRKKTFFI